MKPNLKARMVKSESYLQNWLVVSVSARMGSAVSENTLRLKYNSSNIFWDKTINLLI